MGCAGREGALEELRSEVARVEGEAAHLQRELRHKEEAVGQLKAQLEHQCLGEGGGEGPHGMLQSTTLTPWHRRDHQG